MMMMNSNGLLLKLYFQLFCEIFGHHCFDTHIKLSESTMTLFACGPSNDIFARNSAPVALHIANTNGTMQIHAILYCTCGIGDKCGKYEADGDAGHNVDDQRHALTTPSTRTACIHLFNVRRSLSLSLCLSATTNERSYHGPGAHVRIDY